MNRRNRDTEPSADKFEELAEEGCPECERGDCGARCPHCCQMVEYLAIDRQGRYSCVHCGFFGSYRQLMLKLIQAGRLQ